MLQFSPIKIAFIILVCLFGAYFCIPSALGDKAKNYAFLPDSQVNLGLDLRGGSYLLLEVDFNTYLNEQLDILKGDIRNMMRQEKVNGQRILYTGGMNTVSHKIAFTLNDATLAPEVVNLVKALSKEITVDVVNGNRIEVGYDDLSVRTMQKNLMEQSIEIVRRRVDETGTREPDIQRQGDSRILLQVPGLDNPEHLKGLLGKTAKLTFHLLNENMPYPDTGTQSVPPGTMRLKAEDGTQYAILKNVLISGEMLANASTGINQYGQPVVNIRFNNVGSKKFGDITKENVGKPFAIVLDGKVLTAPVIRSVILGGSAEISGSFTTQSAQDLALLLRAGALPAPLNIIEERSVGPSLGADSIEAGKNAVIVSTILVMGFMWIFYGLFGFFANVALAVNMILLIAVISLFDATLTLPGIAGIVLTMGMAVDANVLIFERIREEVHLGTSPFAAIDRGFRHAFGTIMDSNVTTLMASILLYMFGSGPVKGFAVTLSVGIVTSMFSATLLTRMLIVLWLKKKRPAQLAF